MPSLRALRVDVQIGRPNLLKILDEQIAETQQRLEKLQACRRLAAEIEGSVAPSIALVPPSAGGKTGRGGIRPRAMKASPDADLDQRILDLFAKERKPLSKAAIEAALDVSRYRSTQALDRLCKAKQLQSRGVTASLRFGTAEILAAADAEED